MKDAFNQKTVLKTTEYSNQQIKTFELFWLATN